MKECIILGSASPRRKELLNQIKLDSVTLISDIDENIKKESIKELVVELSYKKAVKVFRKLVDILDNNNANDFISNEEFKKLQGVDTYIIITADTIVSYKNKILGKPKNEKDAFLSLSILNGNMNTVYTGVSIIAFNKDKKIEKTWFEKTDVYMKNMSNEDIREYINTKEPLDKAGSYAIQGIGAKYIEKIDGDYNNVVGLPISSLWDSIQEIRKCFDINLS